MDIDLQRRIDRTAGTVLCGILSLFPRKDRGRGLKSDPKGILVILLSEMGSLVLARPMFTFLREKYQEAPIYAMVFKRNAECLEVLDLIPPENIFTVDGDSFSGLIRDSIRALRGIRIKEIDTVIDCELFSRISSIYSFLSGAEIRVGFHPHTQEGLYRGHFINRPVLYNPYHHISRQYLNLAKAIELDHMPLVKRKMDDHIPPPPALDRGSVEEMEKRLMGDFPQLEGKKLVLIYPGGGLLPIRAWPLGHFCAAAQDLIEKGYAAGIIGMKQDAGLAEAILAACRSELAIDLTGYTRKLHELITLFHLAALLITNDGGPGHFASLTPIPAIVLFGPETPALYGPLDDKSVALHHPLSCSPCLTAYNHRNSPCDGNNLCLKSLSVEKVLDRAYALLKGGPVPGDEHGQPAGKV